MNNIADSPVMQKPSAFEEKKCRCYLNCFCLDKTRKLYIKSETVPSFGDGWARFGQSGMSADELRKVFDEYFTVFPRDRLPPLMTMSIFCLESKCCRTIIFLRCAILPEEDVNGVVI